MQQLIAWWIFTVRGWKVEGQFPFELKKSILVVAPHTHYLDFFLGLAIRKKVSRLRTGFYHIAKNANIPIILVGLDFGNKKVVFGEAFYTSNDETADKQKIVAFFKGMLGYIPD